MSELPPEGYPEGSRRVWGLTLHVDLVYFYSREILREALENVNRCNIIIIISFLLSMLSTSEYAHLELL